MGLAAAEAAALQLMGDLGQQRDPIGSLGGGLQAGFGDQAEADPGVLDLQQPLVDFIRPIPQIRQAQEQHFLHPAGCDASEQLLQMSSGSPIVQDGIGPSPLEPGQLLFRQRSMGRRVEVAANAHGQAIQLLSPPLRQNGIKHLANVALGLLQVLTGLLSRAPQQGHKDGGFHLSITSLQQLGSRGGIQIAG